MHKHGASRGTIAGPSLDARPNEPVLPMPGLRGERSPTRGRRHALCNGCAALAIAAGLATASLAANAADLGGDCCADLEGRLAELEATTARRGNRKMSLTITGQVNRMIAYWDDGYSSKTYYGLDNTNSSSRFSFLGSARVNPNVTMGFEIMLEIEAGGTASKASQLDEDGKLGSQICGTLGCGSFNQPNVDAFFADARRVAWWIEHDKIGRLTVGRYDGAGPVATIDLGGISVIALNKFGQLNAGFFLRGAGGQWFNATWNNLLDPGSIPDPRTELARYDSPAWHGFIFSASIAEAGDYWGAMLRYAGEFNALRVAAGIGYEKSTDRLTLATLDPSDPVFIGPLPKIPAWGAGLSVMHVPSGLFVQGHYVAVDFNGISNGYWGTSATNAGANPTKKDASYWLIQGGVSRNWFAVGKTAVYGEYGRAVDFGADAAGRDYTGEGFTPVLGVVATQADLWGGGVVQHLDAAATELYVGYRRFLADVDTLSGPVAINDFAMLGAGARVRF
jgi:hypothetical protein